MKKMVMQLGAGDPMEMPVEMSGEQAVHQAEPRRGWSGRRPSRSPAGSFKTKHYRDKTPQGDKLDYWVSDTVPPFGLVKVEVEQKNNPQIKGKLIVRADGARARTRSRLVTKPPKPFDQAALMQQMMAAAGQGRARARPSRRPPPAATHRAPKK